MIDLKRLENGKWKYKLRRVVLGALIVISALLFVFAGRLLYINQAPLRSSVIIILGGGDGERELEASRLYHSHYAPYVIVSNGGWRGHPSTAKGKQEVRWLEADGVPSSAIIREFRAKDTYENALFTKWIVTGRHWQSAIVVSSSYHMRRGQFIFNLVYSGSHVRLTYCAASVPGYNPKQWWVTASGRHFVFSEYKKLIGYVVWYGILHRLQW